MPRVTIASLLERIAALEAAAPASPSVASSHWKSRDIACPRGCGRKNFRTIGGANGAHRTPKGESCAPKA